MKRSILLTAISVFLLGSLSLFFQNCAQKNENVPSSLSLSATETQTPATNSQTSGPSLGSSGSTQASVIEPGQPCTRKGYTGWHCLQTTVTSSEGISYAIEYRWNRLNLASKGTAVIAVGGNGNGASREFGDTRPDILKLSDDLDRLDEVRSIEIDFVNQNAQFPSPYGGGYWHSPTGYRSAALAFIAATEKMYSLKLNKGGFVNYHGGSNGSMIAAYSMAHFGADRFFNRVVLSLGPFLGSLADACNPNHWASFQKSTPDQISTIKSLTNYWASGDKDRDACTLSTDRMSILPATKKARFSKTAVHVFVGADEVTRGFGQWILESNLQWFHSIEAAEKTRVVMPGVGHEGTFDFQRSYLRLSPPKELSGLAPQSISLSSLSVPGPVTQIPINGTLAGEVLNLFEAEPLACISKEESFVTFCDNPHNWVRPKDNGWIFSENDRKWKSAPASVSYTQVGDRFKGFWINTKTGVKGNEIQLEVIPPTSLTRLNEPAGRFCANQKWTYFICNSGNPGTGWNSVGNSCYHFGTQSSCQ